MADVLFGDYSPAGRLPITFVKSESDLPPILNYSMKKRTYRYLEIEPLYPFGFGLSYTTFEYSNLTLNPKEIKAGEDLEVSVDVQNVGKMDSDEVVQVHLKDMEASVRVPNYQLSGVKRAYLKTGEKKQISFTIKARQMGVINRLGKCILEPGEFKILINGCQPDKRSLELLGAKPLEETFKVSGEKMELQY